MDNKDNSVISINNTKNQLGQYICNSPCLKTLFHNPFIISALILLIIWVMDFIYGKTFHKDCGPSTYIQHMITTYAIVSIAIWMNDTIFSYQMSKNKSEEKEKKEKDLLTAEYIASD